MFRLIKNLMRSNRLQRVERCLTRLRAGVLIENWQDARLIEQLYQANQELMAIREARAQRQHRADSILLLETERERLTEALGLQFQPDGENSHEENS